jgi:hypothetical protein
MYCRELLSSAMKILMPNCISSLTDDHLMRERERERERVPNILLTKIS